MMGALSKLSEQRSHPSQPAYWLEKIFGGAASATGKSINEDTAMTYAAFWACAQLLSNTIASLPLHVLKRIAGGAKERADTHYLYPVLHDMACPIMTAFAFWSTAIVHICTHGNAYASIVRVNGRVKELWLMPPNRVKPEFTKDKQLIYKVRLPEGGEAILFPDEVLHLKGLSTDGITGLSPVRQFKEAIGLGLSIEEYGARFFGEGSTPPGVLTTDNALSPEARENMRKSWQENHGGLEKAHRVALLEMGTKFQQIGVDPQTAQMLESRRYTKGEMADIFGIPRHMVGDLSQSTNNNIEHQGIEGVVYCFRPRCVNYEQSLNQLLLPSERVTYYTRFNLEGLLRGDSAARSAYYAGGRQWGYLSINDVRALEDMNPVDGGDEYMVPLNMIPATQIGMDAPQAARSIEQRSGGAIEVRNRRAALERTRIRKSFRPIFEDFTTRIVKREKADIMRKAEKLLRSRSVDDLTAWLEDFYQKMPAYIKRQAQPAYKAFITEINRSAAEQAGIDPATAAEISGWAKQYADGLATQYSANSLGQLNAVLRDAEDDPLAELEGRLSEWEEKRPGKTWLHESVFIAGAVAGATWAGGGFSKERWVTNAGACPICQEMDGVVTSIEDSFVSEGDFAATGKDQTPFRFSMDIIHPPLHSTCVCDTAPE